MLARRGGPKRQFPVIETTLTTALIRGLLALRFEMPHTKARL
jgi:hypothetical protein